VSTSTPALASCFTRVTLWLALLACVSPATGAEPQQPPPAQSFAIDEVSTRRVGEALKAPPAKRRLALDVQMPMATFRATVEQRIYLPTLEEQLRKEFELTDLQRQSQDWSTRCCGLNLGGLLNGLGNRLKRREARKIREEVLRELALVEAAARKR